MRKIEREVELKWRRATIKNDLIFTWLFFENKKLTLRLLQIILPELNIKKVGDTQRENNQKKNKIYRGVRFDVLAEDEQGRTYGIHFLVWIEIPCQIFLYKKEDICCPLVIQSIHHKNHERRLNKCPIMILS